MVKANGKLRRLSMLGAAASIAVLGVIGTNLPAHADPDKVAAAKKTLDGIEEQTAQLSSDYTILSAKLAESNQKLAKLTTQQKAQEAELATVKASFGQLAMMQYQTSGVDATARLLAAPDDTAFLNQLTTVQTASGMVNQKVQNFQVKQAKLNSLKAQATATRNQIAADTTQQKALLAKSKQAEEKATKTLAALTKEEKERLAKAQAAAAAAQAAQQAARSEGQNSRSRTTQSNSNSTTKQESTTTPAAPADASGRAATAIAYAMSKVGGPYVYGGTGPTGFDCSGLTGAAWRAAGVSLPRTSQAQYSVGVPVSMSQLQPGDLVFYYSGITHVGMYIGNGKIVHAANPRTGISVTSVSSMPFMGGRRVG